MQGVYIETEGRQFGLETRVRLLREAPELVHGPSMLHRIDGPFFLAPVLRMRLWALAHGYGWPTVR